MNRFKKAFLVVTSMAVLTACGGSSEDAELSDTRVTMSERGILSVQEANDGLNGTHYIMNGTGEKVAVRSLNFNLSENSYLGNRVEVSGQLGGDGVLDIEAISLLEVIKEDVKPELVKYSDSNKGVEFEHYDNFELLSNDGEIVFADDEGKKIDLQLEEYSVAEPTEGEDVMESALIAYVNSELGGEISSEDLLLVGPDQLPAYEEEGRYYFYRNSGMIYVLAFENVEGDVSGDTLNSFRFIGALGEEEGAEEEVVSEEEGENEVSEEVEDDSSSDDSEEEELVSEVSLPEVEYELTVFESLPYSFTGSYPNNWYYAGSSSSEDGVMHEYGFGKEVIEEENELITLKVISKKNSFDGEMTQFGEREFYLKKDPDLYILEFNEGNRSFRIEGPSMYSDLILNMANDVKVDIED